MSGTARFHSIRTVCVVEYVFKEDCLQISLTTKLEDLSRVWYCTVSLYKNCVCVVEYVFKEYCLQISLTTELEDLSRVW